MSRASVETYHRLEGDGILSARRLQTFASLMEGEAHSAYGLTHNEVAEISRQRWPTPRGYRHNAAARLCELEEMGLVRRVRDDVACPVSGETCTTWETVDATPAPLAKTAGITKTEAIRALCVLVERAMLGAQAANQTRERWARWLEDAQRVLGECSRYRKDAK